MRESTVPVVSGTLQDYKVDNNLQGLFLIRLFRKCVCEK